MEDSIKIVDLTSFRSSESKNKLPVPKFFLDMIGDSETLSEIDTAMELIESCRDFEDLVIRKALHLATVRKKIILRKKKKN